MRRYRLFKIETVKQTNTRPERIKITDMWWKESVTISYRCDGPSTRNNAALEYLEEKRGIIIANEAPTQNKEMYFLAPDFKIRLKPQLRE